MRVETSFDLVGDLIGVDAVVVGPTGRAKVQLILDTGAVMTTVVPNVAASIGYSSALRVGWTVTRTAAAEERGYIVRSEVSTLGFTARPGLGLAASRAVFQGAQVGPEVGPSSSRRATNW